MAQTAVARPDPGEMTAELLSRLALFDKVGVAPRDRFEQAPPEYHPSNVMADFASIIAFAQAAQDTPAQNAMGVFDNLLGVIAAQDAAMSYLRQHGYRTALLLPTETRVSLPRIGEQAGIGEISGVNSLFGEQFGLRARLGAIVTDAPLIASTRLEGDCTECWACVDVCPAAEEPHEMDPSRCTACGECVDACPF